MSRLFCCLRARPQDMGAALSHPQEEASDAGVPAAPPTMADVIRERKKKAGGAGLGTLRRRIAAAARRPRDSRPDRGCEHARFIRSVVSSWRLVDVFLLCEELEAGAALRDLATQADLAREPQPALPAALPHAQRRRWWCDVELVGAGWSLAAHRAILATRSNYFRDLLQRYPPGCCRVPLEGAGACLSRAEAETAVFALYGSDHCSVCTKYERGANAEGDLDIIGSENTLSRRRDGCGCVRRLGALLGFSPHSLHQDMRYLLDSGEWCDAWVSWGEGGRYGFRGDALPCHRVVLAARSRFFRNVMSRGGCAGGAGAVVVDEKVLPRRFARALLHAAYTDQVDLTLIRRDTSSPSSTSTSSGSTAWGGAARGRNTSLNSLMDAFQLYEIARFLEMPIVVQGCEDCIVEALCPETLPHVLRWAAAPHASQWVHRQAMRYLRDEFPAVMAAGAGVPLGALADALHSPFLQAGEPQVLRALLRWAADHNHEPNVVWHTAHCGGARRGARRRSADEAALREALAPLLAHTRLDHLPRDHDVLLQLVRRGIISAERAAAAGTARAWLARPTARPPRCFLPYLDELKALLAEQAVPEAELARARRARYLHTIPDTLYMVAAARDPAADAGTGAALSQHCLSPRTVAALRARVRELRATPAANRARALPRADPQAVRRQIALRAVREMSLPDACADILLGDNDDRQDSGPEEWDAEPAEEQPWTDANSECCRSRAGAHCAADSPRAQSAPAPSEDNSRASTCRRDQTPRAENAQRPSSGSEWWSRARLSAAVPDVAMAPNANTHLLTARDYFRQAPRPPWDYSGVVLQLDLGDGATHTPRPGSRAARASSAAQSSRHREPSQVTQAMSCLRARSDDDELRAAIELSVMRAYSSFNPRASSPWLACGPPATLPPLPAAGRASPHNVLAAEPAPLLPMRGGRSASPSPRRSLRPDYSLYRHRDHRLDGYGAGGSAGSSRTHSPNKYA